MKKIFMLATCCSLLFGCYNEKKDEGKIDDGTTTAVSSGDRT